VTARAVHRVRENSKGCSTITSVETANSCSQRTRKQQGLFNDFISGTATAVYRSEITARAVQQIHSGGSRQQGLFAAETSTPAIREFNRFSSAPILPRGFVPLS
jgi:hypothetical protein